MSLVFSCVSKQKASTVTRPPATVDRLSYNQLRRINPFSRHEWRQGRNLYPELRKHLVHGHDYETEHAGFQIALCLKMTAAFATPLALDKMRVALARRFGADYGHYPYVVGLNHQRRFDEALRYCGQLLRAQPEAVAAKLMLIDQLFVAGFPGKGVQLIKRSLPDIAGSDRQHAHNLASILIEAGQLNWLKVHHADLIKRLPRAALANRLSGKHCAVPVYCISLPADHRRLSTTRYFIETGGPFHLIEGVAGRLVSEVEKSAVVRGDRSAITNSEIGCSLSHVKAWELIAATNSEDEYALIIEDDARFIFGAPIGLQDTIDAARSKSAQLVFTNRRACEATVKNLRSDAILFADVDAGTHATPQDWKPRDPGWGADGYLVTGAMAAKLVTIWRQIGVLGALDWQLQMICHKNMMPWHSSRTLRSLHAALAGSPQLPMVAGFTTNTPLIDTRDHGFSSINAG